MIKKQCCCQCFSVCIPRAINNPHELNFIFCKGFQSLSQCELWYLQRTTWRSVKVKKKKTHSQSRILAFLKKKSSHSAFLHQSKELMPRREWTSPLHYFAGRGWYAKSATCTLFSVQRGTRERQREKKKKRKRDIVRERKQTSILHPHASQSSPGMPSLVSLFLIICAAMEKNSPETAAKPTIFQP